MQTPRTKIVDALRLQPPQAELRVKGWVRTARDSKQVVFLELNDGSCFASIQVVADAGIPGYDKIAEFTTGSSCVVEEIGRASCRERV